LKSAVPRHQAILDAGLVPGIHGPRLSRHFSATQGVAASL
jgi:hypothetical protein